MNKPIRCTTHFHACDCREYEFEKLRKENQEMREALDKATSLWNCGISEKKIMNEIRVRFKLSETPNSSKEEV